MAHDPRQTHGLPSTPRALVELADRLFRQAPRQIRCLERGRIALRKALDDESKGKFSNAIKPFDIHWRLGWAAFLLAEILPAQDQRLTFVREGIAESEKAIDARQHRVEGHYYLAVNLGKLAEITGDVTIIPRAIAAAQRAARADERFDRGGPLIFLGKVYLTAPPWPVSVGNPAKAIEHLERAMRLAPRPLTRLFLGQAYYEDERYEEARPHLERALEQAQQLAPRWRREAADALRRLREELPR